MNEEKQKTISVLRAIIISSPQRGKSVRELARDYYQNEGKNIPTFEHRHVEDFLRSSGEFIFENIRGELIVYEKPNSESWHIAKFVAEQHKPRRRPVKSFRPQRFVRPPQTNVIPRHIRSAYPFPVAKSPSKQIFPRKFGNNVTNMQRTSQVPIHQRAQAQTIEFSFDQLQSKEIAQPIPIRTSDQQQQPKEMSNNHVQNRNANDVFNMNRFPPSQPYDLRDRLNESRKITSNHERPACVKQIAYVDLTKDDSDGPKNNNHQTTANKSEQDNRLSKITSPFSPTISENSFDSSKYFSNKTSADQKDAQQITVPSSAPVYSATNPFFDACKQPPTQSSQLTSRIQDRLKNPPKYDILSKTSANVCSINDRKSTVNDRLVQARQNCGQVVDLTKQSDFSRNVSTYFCKQTLTINLTIKQLLQLFFGCIVCETNI